MGTFIPDPGAPRRSPRRSWTRFRPVPSTQACWQALAPTSASAQRDAQRPLMRSAFLAAVLVLGAGSVVADEQQPVKPRHVFGTLHGFPSMSDTTGQVIADGELTQERAGDRLRVKIRWAFADGREVEERDEFQVDRILAQRSFSWDETRGTTELRRFEIDFPAGTARASVRNEKGELEREESKMELPAGRSFAGYGTALALGELSPAPGEEVRITFV